MNEHPHPCGQCKAPASLRCSRCASAWYCDAGCQKAAWKGHKGACTPHRTRCTHGAPAIAAWSDGALACTQLGARLVEEGAGAGQLELLAGFAAAEPEVARSAFAPAVLSALAADAVGRRDGAAAATYLRGSGFLEGYASGGSAFLSALTSEAGMANKALQRYCGLLDRLISSEGLLSELRQRLPCDCLGP
jgi:hypothetical protein